MDQHNLSHATYKSFFLAFSATLLHPAHIQLSEKLSEKFGIPDITDWCITHIPITPPFTLTETQYVSVDKLLDGLQFTQTRQSLYASLEALEMFRDAEGVVSIVLTTGNSKGLEHIRQEIIAGLLKHNILEVLNSASTTPAIPIVRWKTDRTDNSEQTVLALVEEWLNSSQEITVDTVFLFEESAEGDRWKKVAFWELAQQ